MSAGRKLILLITCLAIIAIAILVGMGIIISGPKPERKVPQVREINVKVEPLIFEDRKIELAANGVVEASRMLALKAEVQGRVVEINPKLQIGWKIKKDELLFQIEKLDFESVLALKKSELQQALLELEIEKGRQSLSKREWELIELKNQASDQEKKLALREPQLNAALARLEAAKAEVALAGKKIARTQVKAPFDAIVIHKNVELGSQVSAQETVLTLVADSPYWVRVSLPYDKVKWLEVRSGEQSGSIADVGHLSQQENYKGEVLKVLPDLDPKLRMAQVLIEINMEEQKDMVSEPLLLNSYVRVLIKGKELQRVVAIAREHLKEGGYLYVLSSDNTLDIRKVESLADGREGLLILSGLKPQDQLITSRISAPVQGMKLSVLRR